MEDSIKVRLVEILHKLGLTEEMLHQHVIRPEHIKTATLHIELRNAGEGDDDPSEPPPPSGFFYRLNVEKLSRELHDLLSACVVGYSMKLRRNGRTVFNRQWNWSKTPGNGDVPWASHVPMHIASVSKLITAMAMTKLLHSRNISPDARIAPWLPKYWVKGPGVDQITFRQLLTHTSGLVALDQPGLSDFHFMKEQIALGTVGKPGYRNMNFGLCRILISTIDAPFLFDLLPTVDDKYWDLTTTRYYAQYVSENVFAPVGVTSTFVHTEENALAYPFPPNVPGWNSGDLTAMSGGCSWHLSVDDLLKVMAAFRRSGTIVDPARAQTMLDRRFGIDVKEDTALGRIYAKGGFWTSDQGAVEQSNVFFLPKGMELVILANSPFCAPNMGFMGKVLETIKANIESTLAIWMIAAVSAVGVFGLFRKVRRPRKDSN